MFGRIGNKEMRRRLIENENEFKYLYERHRELETKYNRLIEHLGLFEHRQTIHEYRKKGGPEEP